MLLSIYTKDIKKVDLGNFAYKYYLSTSLKSILERV